MDLVRLQLLLEGHGGIQALTQTNEVEACRCRGPWMITAAMNERTGRGEDSGGVERSVNAVRRSGGNL